MEINHIKYYSDWDLSTGYMLGLAEKYLDRIDSYSEIKDVNEALEAFNVNKLIDSGCTLEGWDEERHLNLINRSKRLKTSIGWFCATIDDSVFISYFENTDLGYREDFFDLIETYNVFSHISDKTIKAFLYRDKDRLWQIAKHEKIVKKYDSVIADYMVTNQAGAELLILHYFSADDFARKYRIPKGLTNDEKKEIIIGYIYSDYANPNYLSLIIQPIDDPGLRLDDKTRYLALKRREQILRDLFSEQSGIAIGAEVSFIDCDEDSIDTSNPFVPKITYSRKWVEDNKDYPTLLNNLIYMFGQVDKQKRCTFVSKKNNLGVFERHLGIRSKKEYAVGAAYHQSQYIQNLSLVAYDRLLQEFDIEFEAIIKWFFTDYLKEEFEVEGFNYSPSSKGTSMTEKCRNLLCEMDSLLKQFKMFAEDGEINRELLELSSTPVSFEAVPSMISSKYAYLKDEETLQTSSLLFSDQTMLGYTERTRGKYNTLVDLLMHENVSMSDYAHFQVNELRILIDRGVIKFDSHGWLRLDKEKVLILKDFYDNEVINITIVKNSKYLQELIDSGKAQVEGTLLSVPEQDYLDYILNRRKFSNGLDLRNRYIHGTNSLEDKPEDYYRIFLIMCLLIIKINEEFCLREEISS